MTLPLRSHGLRGYKASKCRCQVCTDAYDAYRASLRKVAIVPSLIDGKPLTTLLRERGMMLSGGTYVRKMKRWETAGISIYEADKVCVSILGMHPIEVFGQAYFDGLAEEVAQYEKYYGDKDV